MNDRPQGVDHPAGASWRAIARNRNIRDVELGWTLSVWIDWLLLIVALVVAYDEGGAVLAGLVPLFRMAPATLVSAIVDTGRFARPERSLPIVGLVRAAAAALIAVATFAGLPIVVFVAVVALVLSSSGICAASLHHLRWLGIQIHTASAMNVAKKRTSATIA